MTSTRTWPDQRPSAADETLRLTDVTVRFGGLTALSDISLATRVGEFVGLIGPNGSGKTTMLNVIAGLVRPSSGNVRICDVPSNRITVHRRAHRGLGRTFQRAMLFPELTVGDHLLLATEVRRLWKRAVPNPLIVGDIDIEELVTSHPWRLDLQQPVSDLSLAGVRMVELGMALLGQPRILLLDEPLSGLDHVERTAIGNLLLDVRSRFGITIVLIEHDVESVLRLAERLVVLDFGVKIADGPTASIIEDPKVRQAYFGGQEVQ